MNKLFNYYSFDECIDESTLFEKLDLLSDQDKIEYSKVDKYLLKIVDIELGDDDVNELSTFLSDNSVHPYLGFQEESNYDSYDDYDDDDYDDDYNGGNYRSDYDDDY